MTKQKYLSEKKFAETFENAPRVAVVLFIRNKKDEVLLVRRAVAPQDGLWSLPGAFVLKNESIADCVSRIGVEKLGVVMSKNDCRIYDVFEYPKDPRGHVIQVVYKYRMLRDILLKPWGESMELGYFGTSPADMAFNHKEIFDQMI